MDNFNIFDDFLGSYNSLLAIFLNWINSIPSYEYEQPDDFSELHH